jgi:hypothetical protein
MSKKKLIPPDFKRCQYEVKEGSFMTFGPRKIVRCDKKPVFIAYENEPQKDGLKGSMSLCKEHAEVMVKAFGLEYATLIPIKQLLAKKKRKKKK